MSSRSILASPMRVFDSAHQVTGHSKVRGPHRPSTILVFSADL